ncbi:MAG: hypothetical protein ACE15D_09865 [Candidatus Eisenbacteria bacterium]
MSFALVDPLDGETVFHDDQTQSADPGSFDERVESEAVVEDARAHSWAQQVSEIGEVSITVDADFQAEATIGTTADFAEALGATQLDTEFLVDSPMQLQIVGTLSASGNGVANFSLIGSVSGVVLYHSIREETIELNQSIPLGVEDFRLSLSTSGYGQAFEDEENPASGGFHFDLFFLEPAAVSANLPGSNLFETSVSPNPVSRAAEIRFHGIVPTGREMAVFDAAGRLVRDLGRIESSAVLWDTEDRAGRPVSPGVYFARVEGSPRATRILVMRR